MHNHDNKVSFLSFTLAGVAAIMIVAGNATLKAYGLFAKKTDHRNKKIQKKYS